MLQKHKLAPVSQIFVSPFLRTAESGLEMRHVLRPFAATELKLKVEKSIAELAGRSFFKSFGVKGHSTGKWGGPRMDKKKIEPLLIPHVHEGISKLHNSADTLAKALEIEDAFDMDYESFYAFGDTDFTYSNPESREQEAQRLYEFFQYVLEAFPNETVLCVSHGSPVYVAHVVLTGDRRSLRTGYSCLSIYSKTAEADRFRDIVVASNEHLNELGTGKGASIYYT